MPGTSIHDLLREALEEGPKGSAAKARAREQLGLDELNWSYFFALFQRKLQGGAARALRIHEPGADPGDSLIAYPSATAPEELKRHLRAVEYAELAAQAGPCVLAARRAALWIKKMQAGSGSSLTRTTYLSRLRGVPVDKIRIGAKGTDLQVDVGDPARAGSRVSIPIAEAQLLQSVLSLRRGEYGAVIFHDIVSSETETAVRELWDKPSLLEPGRSYRELVEATPGLSRSGETYQHFIPTLDEAGQVTFNRKAPGGHALFAVDALIAAYRPERRPEVAGKALVAAISNGEDLSSAPDPLIVGYLVEKKVPIALVTTEKTAVDGKGGIISLLRDRDGAVSLTVLETAQAKEAGQLKLFESLRGSVSTNLTLFNYEVLVPLLTREVKEIGEGEFLRIIAPDLISNVKEQRDADGVVRKYLQLEGAMGSTIMNLDRYWRRKHGQPLVHIINVDRQARTEFFSPVKSAFDYFMQFHSDRFSFDSARMRLRNLRPGELPQVSLRDPATRDQFYQDVQNVLEAFAGASLKALDELSIEGQVRLRGVRLRRRVRVVNASGATATVPPGTVLDDVQVSFGADGHPVIEPLRG